MDNMDFLDIGTALPSVETIKEYLKKIVALGENILLPISNSNQKLHNDLYTLTYQMFCYQKRHKKTVTLLNDPKLKKMNITEDDDGFSDSDNMYIFNFINANLLESFVELVALSYLPVKRKNHSSSLFMCELYSRYSGRKHTVFFASKDSDVYIFNETLSDIKFSLLISDYFSANATMDEIIQEICTVVLSEETFAQRQKKITAIAEEFNRDILEKHGFVSGAITFLDFLAWKGLWQSQSESNSLTEVSSLIEDFKNKLAELSQEYFFEAKEIPISSLISISDTIAVFTPKTSKAKIRDLLKIHATFAKYVLEECCSRKYPIRGAITYGEYSTINNIMIGPGIDECASWHELGDWVGVHLTPTAQIYWEDTDIIDGDDVICQYVVPLKSKAKSNYCVRWNLSKELFRKLALKSRALLPEISIKYTNTQEFLSRFSWEGGN